MDELLTSLRALPDLLVFSVLLGGMSVVAVAGYIALMIVLERS